MFILFFKKIFQTFSVWMRTKRICDCLLIQTPTHDNIGDAQIALSEIEFLKDNKISFVEITYNEWNACKKIIIKNKNNFRTILIHGGGNVGNEYMNEENMRRDIIESFPDKKIVLMPQTFHFFGDNGDSELETTAKILNSHGNLHVFFRETLSFEKYGQLLSCQKYICPDIVLHSKTKNKKSRNKKVLFLMRNDNEKVIEDNEISRLKRLLTDNGIEYISSDMSNIKSISRFKRKNICLKKQKQIRNFSLVITDRLHGMVFSYLNSTPCLVFGNYNHKVFGTYLWLKNDKSIFYCENIKTIKKEDILNLIKKNTISKEKIVDKTDYNCLIKVIKEC